MTSWKFFPKHKYIKREPKKLLSDGVDFRDFDCPVRASAQSGA